VAQFENSPILPSSPAGPRSLFEFFLALLNSRFRGRSRFSLGIDMNRGRRTDGEASPVLRGIFEYDVDYFSGWRTQPQ
jgi:hypothetical protein